MKGPPHPKKPESKDEGEKGFLRKATKEIFNYDFKTIDVAFLYVLRGKHSSPYRKIDF
jgi:hypothetical protein